MNSVYETRKARQDFDGLGELFLVLFPESGSIYFFILLGLVAAETIGEGEAYDSAKVHFVDNVLTSVGVVQMIVACLEDVVAVGFQLELVILERLPGEGCVEIARGWDVDDSLDGVGMNGSIEVEKHMLAKEKSAVPLA